MTLTIDVSYDRVSIFTTPGAVVVINRPMGISPSQWYDFWEAVRALRLAR